MDASQHGSSKVTATDFIGLSVHDLSHEKAADAVKQVDSAPLRVQLM